MLLKFFCVDRSLTLQDADGKQSMFATLLQNIKRCRISDRFFFFFEKLWFIFCWKRKVIHAF